MFRGVGGREECSQLFTSRKGFQKSGTVKLVRKSERGITDCNPDRGCCNLEVINSDWQKRCYSIP